MKSWTKSKGARHALVIKDHVIRYVGSKRPQLEAIYAHGERYLPPNIIKDGQIVNADLLLTILEECLSEWGLKRHNVQFCIPDGQVTIRLHKVDAATPDDEVKGQLYLDLGESLLLPFEEPVFDYVVLREHEGQKDILLFASREKVVHGYVELLEEVKLKPNAADLSSLSAYRLFHELQLTNEDNYTMLIQVDITSTNLTIFHQHHPVFSRTITSELNQERWGIKRDYMQASLVWKDDEEMLFTHIDDQVREIEKVMNFYQFNVLQGKGQIGHLLVCSDHPYANSFVLQFKQAFSAKLICLDDETEVKLPSRYYDVIGLSLKKEVR
jgi:type IV pilus assembly protein PilM